MWWVFQGFAWWQISKNSDIKDGIWVTNKVVEKVGLKTGDKIIAIDNDTIQRFTPAINNKILTAKVITVERNKEIVIYEVLCHDIPVHHIGHVNIWCTYMYGMAKSVYPFLQASSMATSGLTRS